MKRELLLSGLILGSPMAHISASAATKMRAAVLEQIERGRSVTLTSDVVGTYDGREVKLQLTLSGQAPMVGEPNLIDPELSGYVKLVAATGEVVTSLGDPDGLYIFDLVHADDYSSKYVGYDCSSTMRCMPLHGLTVEFVKDEKGAVVIIQPPEGLKTRFAGRMWIEVK